MKVLFVYKFLTLGGVETVLRARMDGLARHGIEASAWFLHDLGGRGIFAGCEERVEVGDAASCLERSTGFDLLATIDTEEVLPGFREARRRPKLVVECHSPYLENLEYLRGLAVYRPRAVLVPSEHQRGVVRERAGSAIPVHVVPNPLRSAFAAEPRPFAPPPPAPVVAWIGRLDSLKNWRLFLAVGADVVRARPDVELWIVGKSPQPDGGAELLAEAKRQGALPRLRWFRGLPHDRVPALLDAVRDSGGVVVSTSSGESFGMTVAEGMARRCAVVAPRHAPFTEFVEDGVNGALYHHGSSASAAQRIGELLADAGARRRLGAQARESILANHAPDTAIAALARTLRDVGS
jgi:glycosyltransferase involved in cell wall biosynthesis